MQLNVKDVAALLDVSEKTVYRWIDDGKLPGYRISGQYRFNRAELLAWATAEKLRVSPAILAEPESEADAPPTLKQALLNGGIYYRISGQDPATCLRHLVEMLRLPEEVDREFLLQVLLARERIEPTALGNGVAMPHLRNPVVLHLAKPLMALCFLERPIDFKALDKQPVHALFTLISPRVKAQIHLQSRLAYALRDPHFMRLIHLQAAREDILAELDRLQAEWDTVQPRPGQPQ